MIEEKEKRKGKPSTYRKILFLLVLSFMLVIIAASLYSVFMPSSPPQPYIIEGS